MVRAGLVALIGSLKKFNFGIIFKYKKNIILIIFIIITYFIYKNLKDIIGNVLSSLWSLLKADIGTRWNIFCLYWTIK